MVKGRIQEDSKPVFLTTLITHQMISTLKGNYAPLELPNKYVNHYTRSVLCTACLYQQTRKHNSKRNTYRILY
jgi:hypothetical protein